MNVFIRTHSPLPTVWNTFVAVAVLADSMCGFRALHMHAVVVLENHSKLIGCHIIYFFSDFQHMASDE